jgi:hypothetical protein
VDRREGHGVPPRRETLAELRDRRHEGDHVLAEAPPVVDGARAGVRRHHLEVEVGEALGSELFHDRVDERRGDAAATRLRHDVEVRQPREARSGAPREREADRLAVALRDEREPRVHGLPQLGELAREVELDVLGRRHLTRERAPQVVQDGHVGGGCGANRHAADASRARKTPSRGATGDLCFEEPGGGHPPRPSPAPFLLRAVAGPAAVSAGAARP